MKLRRSNLTIVKHLQHAKVLLREHEGWVADYDALIAALESKEERDSGTQP